jgi:hypothetical protein
MSRHTMLRTASPAHPHHPLPWVIALAGVPAAAPVGAQAALVAWLAAAGLAEAAGGPLQTGLRRQLARAADARCQGVKRCMGRDSGTVLAPWPASNKLC